MDPKPDTQSTQGLKEGLWVLLILLLAFSFFTPRFIEYSDITVVRIIPGLINFFIVPTLVITLSKIYKGVFKAYFILYGFLAFIGAYILSLTINYKAQSIALDTTGVWGKAIVTAKKQIKLRGEKRWQIKCSFVVNHQQYETRYEYDNKNSYKTGDTLDILYNKDFPKMYRLIKIY